jgi:branched-chain amino acid aminotransferase
MFEGIRCYNTDKGPAIFFSQRGMCDAYTTRRKFTARKFPLRSLNCGEAILETVRANRLTSCYIRPLVFRGEGALGVNPLKSRVDVAVAVWEWGNYLGDSAWENGVDVCVAHGAVLPQTPFLPVQKPGAITLIHN